MLDPAFRPLIKKPLDAAGRWLAGLGLNANQVTIAGLGLGLAAAIAIALGGFAIGLFLFLLSRIADGLDGVVARLTMQMRDQPQRWRTRRLFSRSGRSLPRSDHAALRQRWLSEGMHPVRSSPTSAAQRTSELPPGTTRFLLRVAGPRACLNSGSGCFLA